MLFDEKIDDLRLIRRIKRSEPRLLHRAVKRKENIKVRQLLDEGVDANMTYNHGETPLHYAIKTENYEAAEMLIKHGVDLETSDRKNFTALGYAILMGNTNIIELLLEYGADVNRAQGQYYKEPLMLVCEQFNSYLVQIFFHFGARVNLHYFYKTCHLNEINSQSIELFLMYAPPNHDFNIFEENWDVTLFYHICRYNALKKIKRDDYLKYYFYEECIEELEKMKTIYLDGRISSYDYLLASRNKLINYSKNKNLCDTLERLLKDGKFKFYINMLKINSIVGIRYGRLYDKVNFIDPTGKYSLPISVRDNVLQYLNEKDINNFIRA